MMRAQQFSKLLIITGIFLATQAFTTLAGLIPGTGYYIADSPVRNELSIINPDAYESANEIAQTKSIKQKSLNINGFFSTVLNGDSASIRGIYAEDKFSYPVIQQPLENPGFVSTDGEVVTEFSMAKSYNVTGIIAHNYLAGKDFFELEISDVIDVVYGDGNVKSYEITSIQSYQAISPNSARSQFKDLGTSEQLSAAQLFKRVYMGAHHLTLQTCIQQGEEESWGRLFIIATPI